MGNEQVVSERTWIGAFLALVVGLVAGSVAFPRLVWDRFLWQYFWGPVYSDAKGAVCAVRQGGETTLYYDACPAVGESAIVAATGYTTVSTVGYMLVLLFMLVGVLFVLDRLDVGRDPRLLFALVPFILFGGALRVVEDASDMAVASVADPVLTYPLNTLFISPVIYGTVFLVTLGALLASIWLTREGYAPTMYRALAGFGAAVLALTLAYLGFVSMTTGYVGFHPQVLLVDVGLASILAYGIYRAADAYKPEINAGTGAMGLVVLWAHAIDGVANVVAADWLPELGHPSPGYGAKHVVNRLIIDVTGAVLPSGVSDVVGTSWPFLLVKLAVALLIVWLFDDRIFADSPRYAILLLVAAVAVGLGPGTRDILRVTFAI